MDENTPLNKRKNFFVLTSYNSEESEGDQSAERKRRTARPRADKYILKCVNTSGVEGSQSRVIRDSFRIVPKMESNVRARLDQAKERDDPAPVIIAFTLVELTRYANVVDTVSFESTPEFLEQRKQQMNNGVGPRAITDDQLCVDMQYCKVDFRGVCSILLFLRGMEKPLHTVVQRQNYKMKNSSENLLEKLWTPSLKGYYYKVLVDFSQC